MLDEWISAVKDELGIDLDVDTGVLLDLARDAAHGVARPAAPLTTFLVGYAAAQAGGGPEAVAEAARKAVALAAALGRTRTTARGRTSRGTDGPRHATHGRRRTNRQQARPSDGPRRRRMTARRPPGRRSRTDPAGRTPRTSTSRRCSPS